MDFLWRVFSERGFMPHGHCYLWRPEIVFLHAVSDALVGLAYTSIPFTLVYFVQKRRDVPFSWMFFCFGAFIIACGTTHYMEVVTLWHPVYWLSGAIKAFTALVSVVTAVLLVRLVPQAMLIPSPSAVRAMHAELARSEARFRAASEGMPGSFVLLEADRAGDAETEGQVSFRIAHVNGEARDVLGLTPGSSWTGEGGMPGLYERCIEVLRSKKGREEDIEVPNADGTKTYFSEQIVPLEDGVAVLTRDVTERRKGEETRLELLASRQETREKELLLKEVHHRVKNSLQLVSSLLNLQLKAGLPNGGEAALQDMLTRIRSIALAHERLYHGSSPARIDIGAYVRDIVSALQRSFADRGRGVALDCSVRGVAVGVDVAVPCGLLLSELVSNALKHAFSGRQEGVVEVAARVDNDVLIFDVRDDGIGFPADMDGKRGKTLGLQLIDALVDQLGASLTRRDGGGTEFSVRVPLREDGNP